MLWEIGPLCSERDLMILSLAREYEFPQDTREKCTTTWFHMFGVEYGKFFEN